MASKGRSRIVLVPCPLQGHLTPMLQLGAILHSRGFAITVAHTKYNSPDPSNHPDFVFFPLSDNYSETDTIYGDLAGFFVGLNDNCKVQFQDYLAEILEQHHKVACVIHDMLMYSAGDVAQMLTVPTIMLRTSSATSQLAYNTIPRLQAQGFIPLKDSILEDFVPELHPLRFKDLPIAKFVNVDAILRLTEITSRRTTISGIIWNTIDHLENSALQQLQQKNHYRGPFFPIGPLHKIGQTHPTSLLREDGSCISWLDQQVPKSVIYVSLGSLATVDGKGLAEIAWGLANSNQPFLWVVRPGSVQGSELPEKFRETVGERGCIVKWAPQTDVLAHEAVGGFLSHCGWNSTLESICEGVPMICCPSFGDQMVNARNLSYVWGVGLEMENELERGEIERAIRRLMVDKEGSEIRQRAAGLREKVDASMREGGSSCNSLNDLVEYILSF